MAQTHAQPASRAHTSPSPSGLKLYHAPQSRSAAVLWLLEELRVPYETEIVNIRGKGGAPESYRAIQPNKKVPAIALDGTIVTERAAITLYLTEVFPEAKLAPPPGHPLRAEFLTRLVYTDAVLDPVLSARGNGFEYESLSVSYGTFEDMVANVERILSENEYAVGDTFTAADTQFGTGLWWGLAVSKLMPEKPVFKKYLDRLMKRPGFQRFMEKEAQVAKAAKNGT